MFRNIKNARGGRVVLRPGMRIVLVGGGTGGHFYPLMAIAEAVRERAGAATPALYYLGPHPYNLAALSEGNISFLWCPAGKQRRYFSLLNIPALFITLFGVLVALFHLFRVYPDVVMSKGGFTSVPVVLAAWLLRIPVVAHESDAAVGRANRLAAGIARYIGVAYAETATSLPKAKTALVGVPIRKEVLETKAVSAARAALGLSDTLPLILVLGGSLGAARINTLILDTLDELLPHYHLIHQTGQQNFAHVTATAQSLLANTSKFQHRYRPSPFLPVSTYANALGAADIVIARAGSTTIYEIAAHATPAILIPIPERISHDQRTNAYTYARTGAASVLEQDNLKDGLLYAEVTRIMGDEETYRTMQSAARAFAIRDAAPRIADILLEIANEHD